MSQKTLKQIMKPPPPPPPPPPHPPSLYTERTYTLTWFTRLKIVVQHEFLSTDKKVLEHLSLTLVLYV